MGGDTRIFLINLHPDLGFTPTAFSKDYKCGIRGRPAEGELSMSCDPDGETPCCSRSGWCGNKKEHCECRGCVDFRKKAPNYGELLPSDVALFIKGDFESIPAPKKI